MKKILGHVSPVALERVGVADALTETSLDLESL